MPGSAGTWFCSAAFFLGSGERARRLGTSVKRRCNIRPRSRWIERRDGLGLMSTQRRGNRNPQAIEVDRASFRRRWFRDCGERAETFVSAVRTGSTLTSGTSSPRRRTAVAGGRVPFMAPVMSIIWLAWAWLTSRDGSSPESADHTLSEFPSLGDRQAAHSLYSDNCFATFAETGTLPNSPPCKGLGNRRLPAPQAMHRSFPLHIPVIPVRARLYPTLPQAPAGRVRWAERHDGKRDLYFQHAA